MHTLNTAPKRKLVHFESFCTIQEVRNIKVIDVVARDYVGIRLAHELAPGQEHLALMLEAHCLRTGNGST